MGVLHDFDTAPESVARETVLPCCAAPEWLDRVVALRPFHQVGRLVAVGGDLIAELPWSQVRIALDAHPRIGERMAGAGREAAWSRREQSGAGDADAETASALIKANKLYEERHGHVFLIFATGRSAAEMLAAARERVDNDGPTERAIVREELAKIVRLRLERLFT
ncbi:2-oxo-4-hydroxy-4-carboxy-5-ureidoimidazoline decarboxylase [Virgisporangium aliadipatigenens]|uniref:2-oxo-4-hydroxy-4-carboxy-5-ureidoimidazoline decarboxylase n=1 Tax=Virgisporangium aliadipatigenens TaxID=741659 RepID=A0A8J4DPW1_9ACTN|nr:2-oxo-4-hydroxy-4-carboxy-5-ureidoimidazoline decarboxylase [Virgisporangium aliadipatigenens]GIJ46390.1 2-oxo-4-hydroxy-4-carboxy-5-ureidoimidazoline decarboxylase [Virgisporangium aliadipatigenens]